MSRMLSLFTEDQIRQAAEDFRKAAQVIERKGWAQEEYQTWDGRVCATGAMYLACRNVDSVIDAMDDLSRCGEFSADRVIIAYGIYNRLNSDTMIQFNDKPGRRKEEVIAKLNDTADKALAILTLEPENAA